MTNQEMYQAFVDYNNYWKNVFKARNQAPLRIEKIWQKDNHAYCALSCNGTIKFTEALVQNVIKEVINGSFYLSNPSVLQNFNFEVFYSNSLNIPSVEINLAKLNYDDSCYLLSAVDKIERIVKHSIISDKDRKDLTYRINTLAKHEQKKIGNNVKNGYTTEELFYIFHDRYKESMPYEQGDWMGYFASVSQIPYSVCLCAYQHGISLPNDNEANKRLIHFIKTNVDKNFKG